MMRAYENLGKASNTLDESLFSRPGLRFDLIPAKSNIGGI